MTPSSSAEGRLPARLDRWASILRNSPAASTLTDDERMELSTLLTEAANNVHERRHAGWFSMPAELARHLAEHSPRLEITGPTLIHIPGADTGFLLVEPKAPVSQPDADREWDHAHFAAADRHWAEDE